jgi:hypothetical protein
MDCRVREHASDPLARRRNRPSDTVRPNSYCKQENADSHGAKRDRDQPLEGDLHYGHSAKFEAQRLQSTILFGCFAR